MHIVAFLLLYILLLICVFFHCWL